MRRLVGFRGNRVEILFLAWVAAGCSAGGSPGGASPSGSGGGPEGTVDSGAPATSGPSSGGTGGGTVSGGSSGGSGAPDAANGVTTDAPSGTTTDASTGATPDASAGATPDAGLLGDDSSTPMGTDGGPQPSYDGEIPIYYGPDVGPVVKMQCPGDPTQGWTEYKDTFHVERPYTVPINTRFSITGGIYNFWVFPNDSPHSPIAHGRGPRTEATYGALHDAANLITGNGISAGIAYFTTGMRMWSADMLLESSAAGSVIMQIHTTATGVGPIYMGFAGGNLTQNATMTAVAGSSVPGGLVNQWFNLKVAFNAATLQSQLYVNNCLKGTVSGPRGDGNFYFKNGVYGCGNAAGCHDHYKNIHLYTK
jgi:hypothetical protein